MLGLRKDDPEFASTGTAAKPLLAMSDGCLAERDGTVDSEGPEGPLRDLLRRVAVDEGREAPQDVFEGVQNPPGTSQSRIRAESLRNDSLHKTGITGHRQATRAEIGPEMASQEPEIWRCVR